MIDVQCSADTPLQARVCWDGAVATVFLSGELDSISAPALADDLIKITADHPERVVLDLDDAVFVDVAGARAFDRAVEAFDCPVVVRGLRPSARKVSWASGFSRSCRSAADGR
jgi:anti-anti-sigma factor